MQAFPFLSLFLRCPRVICLLRSAEILPRHLWHRLPGSSPLSQLGIKAVSDFLIPFFCSGRQDLATGILFLVYLSLQQAGTKEIAFRFAEERATTSLQRGAFTLASLTPAPFTVFCSFLAWVFISPWGLVQGVFFLTSFSNNTGEFAKRNYLHGAIYLWYGASGTGTSFKMCRKYCKGWN